MTTSEVGQILAAVARVDEQVKGLVEDRDTAVRRLDKVEGRVTWLDRVAYTALGAGVTSWLPDLAALIP